MTQQRSNDDIREHVAEAVSDYCIHVGPIPPDESVCRECRRIADAVFDADVSPLLARVSSLEQENERLHGVIAHTASDVHDYVRAALADARTGRDALSARAERAEAQIRAVEAVCAKGERLSRSLRSQERAEAVAAAVADVRAALAAGLSLQEEQPTHLVGAGGWRACDTAADWAGSDTTGVTCAECLATTTDVLQEEQE